MTRTTHSFVELGHLDGDFLGLLIPLQLVYLRLLLDDLTQQERKQLFVIPGLREVFTEPLDTHGEYNKHACTEFIPLTRSKVFLMDIFCALTKLPIATEIAKSRSSARTYSRRAIRALASAIRIILSR